MLLEEQFAADSVGAAHQRHRALAQVAQEQVGVARMELGEFQLAGLDRRVDQPLRMADAHAGGGRPRRTGAGLARAAQRRRAGGTLAGHLARRLVFAQAVEHCLADDPATGHLRIGNLAQLLRAHPLHRPGSRAGGTFANGLERTARGSRRSRTFFRLAAVKPLPTLPA